MGVPLGDGGEKKFNWASELSTIEPQSGQNRREDTCTWALKRVLVSLASAKGTPEVFPIKNLDAPGIEMTIWAKVQRNGCGDQVRNRSRTVPSLTGSKYLMGKKAPPARFLPPSPQNKLTQSAEIEFYPPTAQDGPVDDVVTLGPSDFHRIGIQPKETRLDVIRRAASRAAKSLARKQLDAPNPITEEQLSRIAVSTYRLLDPRQREDRQSRAHVGRIRPHALYRAGRTEFAEGRILIQSCEASERSVSTHHVNEAIGVDEIFPVVNAPALPTRRVRSLVSHPGMILAMIVLLLLTAAAIWYWGQTLHSWPARLVPAAESV